jgi:hypothetical protein
MCAQSRDGIGTTQNDEHGNTDALHLHHLLADNAVEGNDPTVQGGVLVAFSGSDGECRDAVCALRLSCSGDEAAVATKLMRSHGTLRGRRRRQGGLGSGGGGGPADENTPKLAGEAAAAGGVR